MRKAYDTTAMINALVEAHGADEEVEVIADNIDTSEPPEPIVPAPEPVAEPDKEQEPAKVAEPTEPAPTEPAAKQSWSDEYAQLKAQIDFLQGALQKQVSQSIPSSTPPAGSKPLREITDESEYAQRMETLEQNANFAYSAIKALEFENAKRALADLKAEFPSIDKWIPENQLLAGVEKRIQMNAIGADWKGPLLQVYDYVSQGERHRAQADKVAQLEAELQKAKDELAAKRADREAKVREVQAAGQVPATGSVYQEAANQSNQFVNGSVRGRRAYDAAARAMTSALRKS